jgi:signal transduction histidine kinase
MGQESGKGVPAPRELVGIFDESEMMDGLGADQRARLYDRVARTTTLAGSNGLVDEGPLRLRFAATVLTELVLERAPDMSGIDALLGRLVAAGIPHGLLGGELVRAPELLALPTDALARVQVGLLHAFTGVASVSLWFSSASGETEQLALSGAPVERSMVRAAAGMSAPAHDGGPTLVRIPLTGQSPGLLVAAGDGDADLIRPLMSMAVPILSAALTRGSDAHGAGSGGLPATEGVRVAERRLMRIRFDLHDGPQQDVVLLAEDLRRLREQVENDLPDHPAAQRMIGYLDDVGARLLSLDGDLRRISVSAQSPFSSQAPLGEALIQLTEAFAQRTGVSPTVELRGDFGDLTDSQQITLVGLIREALTNVRAHAEAENVTISLSADRDAIRATVTDDGVGFEPESTLVRAAREGHLGLVGMHERVRLLGGRTRIDSRPGGPTVIAVELPPAPGYVQRQRG